MKVRCPVEKGILKGAAPSLGQNSCSLNSRPNGDRKGSSGSGKGHSIVVFHSPVPVTNSAIGGSSMIPFSMPFSQ